MGTSPAPLKANGSSRSSGRFKPGGVRPARTGTLTPTQMGVWARAQGSTCARQSCRAGPGSAAALPTRPGATSSGGSAASEGGSHQGSPSRVSTAGPALGSTAAERGSGCFQSSCRARLQAPLPFCSGRGEKRRPFLHTRGPSCPLWEPRPAGHQAPGLDPVLPQPRPRRRPLTRMHAPPGPEPQPMGLMAGPSGHSRPGRGLGCPQPQRKQGLLPTLCCRPCSLAGPSAGSVLSPSWGWAEGPPAPHIHKFSARPSTSRPQDGSTGVCAQPRRRAASIPQGGRLQKLPTRPTGGHPSDLPLLLVLSNRFTFSAEAPTRTQRHRAEAALKLLYKDHLPPSRGKHSRDAWKECTYRYVQTQCCTHSAVILYVATM